MRVVPEQARVRKRQAVGVLVARLNGLLRVLRNTVEAVLEPKPVPVDRCLDGGLVGDRHEDLRILLDPQRGTRDRTVVGQHDVRTIADPLGDLCHTQIKDRTGRDIHGLRRRSVTGDDLSGISQGAAPRAGAHLRLGFHRVPSN